MELKPKAPMSSGRDYLALRIVIARLLSKVLTQKITLDQAFAAEEAELKQKEEGSRAFVLEITSGVLRQLSRIDFILDSYVLKKKPTGDLRKYLEIGLFQLLFQDDVNPKDVIFETVQVIKEKTSREASGFANQLLRKVAEAKDEWKNWKVDPSQSLKEQAAAASLPEWLLKKVVKDLGFEAASQFAIASSERPLTHLRERGSEQEVRVEGDAIRSNGGLLNGSAIVQDLGSQSLVKKVSSFLRERKLTNGIDLCAAPGGKAIGLAWNGFKITAYDESERRRELLKANAERCAKDSITVKNELIISDFEQAQFIWIDAPCSGTGTLSKNPEIRWIREEKDIGSLMKKQRELLFSTFEKMKSGGILIYSVCSVLSDECESHLKALSKSGVSFDSLTEPSESVSLITQGFRFFILQKQ